MKGKLSAGLLLLLLLLPVACTGGATSPTTAPTLPPTKEITTAPSTQATAAPATQATTPPTTKATTPPTTQVTTALSSPSAEQLAKERFALPEISRVTCEQLKQMIDKGDKFVLVDARDQASYLTSHIAGAISIPDQPAPPVTQAWVTDRLEWLPKDSQLIFYCG